MDHNQNGLHIVGKGSWKNREVGKSQVKSKKNKV